MRKLLATCIALTSVVSGAASAQTEEGGAASQSYVLSFNRWGELQTPIEQGQIIADLRAHSGIDRVIIVSYGWANDGEASYDTYRQLLRDLRAGLPADQMSRTAVIAVGWDSTQTGFRKLFGDLIPFPVLASTLAFVPDNVLFPISFWSKAAMADRIGFGGLRTALNEIFTAAYPEGRGHPDVYLLAHSFGTRILSGLLQDQLALLPVRGERFASAKFVRGAVMIQPALILPNLHRTADYPVLVTQSRHDHANGALFPVANLVINTYSFTSFEGIFRHIVVPLLWQPVEVTAEGIARVTGGTTRKESPARVDDEPYDPFAGKALLRPYDQALFLLQRGLAEALSVPLSLAYSAMATPVNYAYAQGLGLWRHPVDHVMDTLAQLPVVEIPVEGLGRLLGREVAWGARGKGFLGLGLTNESSGRLYATPWAEPRDLPVYSLGELGSGEQGECGLPTCSGVLFVDASEIIDEGMFGASLENPWVDFTLGWLDPIGSHDDYRNDEVKALMSRLVMRR